LEFREGVIFRFGRLRDIDYGNSSLVV